MKFKLKYIAILIVFMLVFTAASSFGASAEDFGFFAGEEFDRLQVEIIDLALESSESLIARRDFMAEFDELDPLVSGGGLSADLSGGIGIDRDDDTRDMYLAPQAGISFNYPLVDPGEEVETMEKYLAYREDQLSQIFNLEEEERAIVSSLNNELKNLIEVFNELNGQERLLATLNERSGQLERMVESGLADPEDLWELDERINQIEIELENFRAGQQTMINLIASNYGRDNREEMKAKLLELRELFVD